MRSVWISVVILAFSALAQATPAPLEVECIVTTRQGYSSEAAAKLNPNAASGKITHTNLGHYLASTTKQTIQLNGEARLSISPDSVTYFGRPKEGIEIGSGVFLHVMLSTDDVKSVPTKQWQGLQKAHLYAEVFRKNADGTRVVITSPSYTDRAQFWTPGLVLSADLLGTEPRTALYNLPDDSPATAADMIQSRVAPEGFQLGTHVECTRTR